MSTFEIVTGTAGVALANLPAGSVDCCITSPPYFNMVDYGHPDQIGQETKDSDYIHLVASVFDQVKRVLTKTGTCWIVIGDTYKYGHLLNIPSRVAQAMVDRGWVFRQDIIWCKTNGSRESNVNRPRSNHEHILLFGRVSRHYCGSPPANSPIDYMRSWWPISTEPSTYEPKIFPPAIVAGAVSLGCPAGGLVIDPFCGTGTTGVVAMNLGRNFWGCDVKPETAEAARRRISRDYMDHVRAR